MSRPSIFLRAMKDQRWMVLGIGIGSALMAAMILAIYPSYSEALEDFDIPPAMQAFIGDIDIASASGFITAEFFSWIPILLVVYAIVQGTGALAGEESNGTLDLLLAQPISRTRLLLEKVAAIIAGTFAIIALTVPGWMIPYGSVEIDVSLGRLIVATVAIADEGRQGASAVRTGSGWDALLDLAGGLAAMAGYWLYRQRRPTSNSASAPRSDAPDTADPEESSQRLP